MRDLFLMGCQRRCHGVVGADRRRADPRKRNGRDKFAGSAAAAPMAAPAPMAPMTGAGQITTSAPPNGAQVASDGRVLAGESAGTQAMFQAVWGNGAAVEWVQEHNA